MSGLPGHPFATAPFHRLLGFEVLEASDGRVRMAMNVRAEVHAQVHGQTHGAVITALLDTAAACACHTVLGETAFTSTDFTMQFLRAAPPGRLEARAEIVRKGRRRLVVDASAFDAEGRLCARYLGGFGVLDG